LQPAGVLCLLEIPGLGGKSRINKAHPALQIQIILAE